MLIGRFRANNDAFIGELRDDRVRILARGDCLPSVLAAKQSAGSHELPMEAVEWMPCLDPAARVLAVALNYEGHALETGNTPPERPLFFFKPTQCFVGHKGMLRPNEGVTRQFDYEGEVGVVIGKGASHVAREKALSYVAGIVPLDDGSARDRFKLPAGETTMMDWIASKTFDGSSAIGPVIATGEDVIAQIRDQSVKLETRLNGEVVQRAQIDDLIFSVETLVSVLSEHMTLLPGDVIATGTPSGVGQSTGRYLESGDVLSIRVDSLPQLEVMVA